MEVPGSPVRIVSLVPSQTEYLSDLGLEDRIAGITKFCIHPSALFKSKPHVGGTKNPSLAKIRFLKPDLIIGNREENDKAMMETLMQEFPVWISDVRSLNGALEMMTMIGTLTGKPVEAEGITESVKRSFEKLEREKRVLNVPARRAAYIIWKDPLMTVNGDTFIHEMMHRAGFENIFSGEQQRYPVITMKQLQEKRPDMILMSSEPFPFKQPHVRDMNLQLPAAEVMLVDGELFSWYGSRLRFSADYLQSLWP